MLVFQNIIINSLQADSVNQLVQPDSLSQTSQSGIWDFIFHDFINFQFIDVDLDLGGIHINLARIFVIVLIILANFVIHKALKRLCNNSYISERLELSKRRSIMLIISLFLWFAVILISLSVIGIKISEILNYEIINTKDVQITPSFILIAVLVFIFTAYFLHIIKSFFNRQIEKKAIDDARGRTVFQIIKYIIWMIVVIGVLQSGGIRLTLFLGAGAALLVGIGFGLQQIFADIISGIFLLFERNLLIGDVLEVEGGIVGKVKEIGIRTSKILTRENIIYIIPNSQIISDKVINWSHAETRTRFNVNVGVAYGSDIRLVEKVLLEVAAGHQDLCNKPVPFVRFNDFGESSLDFQLFFWTRKSFIVENIKSDLRFEIDTKFRQNNIEIPFPQRDLHFKSGKPLKIDN